MIEPTQAELGTLDTFKKVADWVGVAEWRTELARELGATDDTLPRLVAAIPRDDFKMLLASLQINGQSPTPIVNSQLGYVWECAQFICGKKKLTAVTEQDNSRL